MGIRTRAVIRSLAVISGLVAAAGCGAASRERDDGGAVDGGVDADRLRPDIGLPIDAGVPMHEDAGPPRPVLCGGRECSESEACCTASGSCFAVARPGDCALAMPPPPESGSGTPCASDADCEAGQFCRVAGGSCIGPGWCFGRDHPGIVCAVGGPSVCACDGRTYATMCDAYAEGSTVSRAGMGSACGSAGPSGAVVCGRDADCAAGQTCCERTSLCVDPACVECCAEPPAGTELGCGNDLDCRSLEDRSSDYYCFGVGCSDTGGGCIRAVGDACTGAFLPVCGCDGVTYSNACWVHPARTRIAHAGVCE